MSRKTIIKTHSLSQEAVDLLEKHVKENFTNASAFVNSLIIKALKTTNKKVSK